MDYIDYINYKLKDNYIEFIESSFEYDKSNIEFSSKEKSDSFLSMIYYIEEGLENDLFMIYFQPQYNIITGELVGAEALARLKDKDGKIFSPAFFIPVAECTNQIYKLEQWIAKTALEHKKNWEDKGIDRYSISINLSAKSLIHDKHFEELLTIIKSSNVNLNTVIIEVTETAIIPNANKAFDNLKTLKDLGIKIALDDFGTGFSSLSHLEDLPVDIIKFDRSLIKKIPDNSKTCSIIKAFVSLSQDLGYDVIAEGIENEEQLVFLKELRCLNGQGFLFAKPVPANELMQDCNCK